MHLFSYALSSTANLSVNSNYKYKTLLYRDIFVALELVAGVIVVDGVVEENNYFSLNVQMLQHINFIAIQFKCIFNASRAQHFYFRLLR